MPEKLRIYITGNRGFLATHLDRKLRCWAEMVTSPDEDEIDIRSESALLEALTHMHTMPDLIIHSAAITGTEKCTADVAEAVRTNVGGTLNVVEVSQHLGIQVLYFSSSTVYDPKLFAEPRSSPVSESGEIKPFTIYGQSKLMGEHVIRQYAHRPIIIRPVFVYGGYRDHTSTISKLIHAKWRLQPWSKERVGTGDVKLSPKIGKDWMYVSDFVAAVETIIHQRASSAGKTFNISAGGPLVSMEDVYRMVVKGDEVKIRWFPKTDYQGHHAIDNSRIRKLGWEPKISLAAGIEMATKEILEEHDND